MTKVFTIAHLPQELTQAWLQHLREFDTAHPGCHFEVAAEAPDATLAMMVEALRVNPALASIAIFERAKIKPEGEPPEWRWIGCGECDVVFDCYKGRCRCVRWQPR